MDSPPPVEPSPHGPLADAEWLLKYVQAARVHSVEAERLLAIAEFLIRLDAATAPCANVRAVDDPAYLRANKALHKLWTEDFPSDHRQRKQDWQELDNAILALWKAARPAPPPQAATAAARVHEIELMRHWVDLYEKHPEVGTLRRVMGQMKRYVTNDGDATIPAPAPIETNEDADPTLPDSQWLRAYLGETGHRMDHRQRMESIASRLERMDADKSLEARVSDALRRHIEEYLADPRGRVEPASAWLLMTVWLLGERIRSQGTAGVFATGAGATLGSLLGGVLRNVGAKPAPQTTADPTGDE